MQIRGPTTLTPYWFGKDLLSNPFPFEIQYKLEPQLFWPPLLIYSYGFPVKFIYLSNAKNGKRWRTRNVSVISRCSHWGDYKFIFYHCLYFYWIVCISYYFSLKYTLLCLWEVMVKNETRQSHFLPLNDDFFGFRETWNIWKYLFAPEIQSSDLTENENSRKHFYWFLKESLTRKLLYHQLLNKNPRVNKTPPPF